MRLRYSLRTLAGFTLVVALVLFFNKQLETEVIDNYAAWDITSVIIQYVDSEGKWPQDWNDLKPLVEKQSGRAGWKFHHYKSRIYIDFKANLEQMRICSMTSEHAAFDVVHARYKLFNYVDIAPNEIIYRHLRNANSSAGVHNKEVGTTPAAPPKNE